VVLERGSAGRLVAVTAAAYACAHASADPDLWSNVKFGVDALRTRSLTAVDPYSFMQDVPWVNHEWLSEVVQAVAYRSGGVFGLLALRAALLAATFAVLALALRRAPAASRWWLLAAGIISMAPATYTFRPQLWTMLLVALVWRALQVPRWRPWIPVIFAVWANLHGGWIVGLGLSTLWLIGRLMDRAEKGPYPFFRRAPVAIAAGIAATLVNPYGWHLWQFVGSTVRVGRNITEWRPVWEHSAPTAGLLWAFIVIAIVAPIVVRRRATLTWASALPIAWLGVMSLLVTRLLPFFGEVAVLGLADAWPPVPSQEGDAVAAQSRPLALALIDVAIVAAVALPSIIPLSRCLPIDGTWTPDLTAAAAFNSVSEPARLVVPFDWGHYAIWHWGPRIRVSNDGRRETVYSERTIMLQRSMEYGGPEGLEYLGRVRPEYIWLRTAESAPVAAWARANGYRIDLSTERSFVATRADLAPLAIGAPMPRCFP
jgi:hypothetical protein